MKRSIIACTASALLISHLAVAQTKAPKEVLLPPPANVNIDGSLDDWADSLRYFNDERKLNYTLANDKDNLYMAIRVSDRTEQIRIMQAGITFGINTKGNKKDMYALTFPGGGQIEGEDKAAFATHHAEGEKITQEDRDEMLHARLTKLHNIKVAGFKTIEGDMITTTNTYGVKAAMNYDKDGYLVCEMEIPFKLFNEFNGAKKEWAFNFKINGITRPNPNGDSQGGGQGGGMRGGMGGGGGMRGGRGGGGMGGGGGMRGGRGGGMGGGNRPDGAPDRSELFKSVEFWEKFWLGGF